MKHVLALTLFFISLVLVACNQSNNEKRLVENKLHKPTVATINSNADTIDGDPASSENIYDTFFVVVVDSSYSYYTLRDDMLKLSINSAITIDTMNRTFDVQKHKIVLPENATDDIYAGDYYPRRFPSISLSIEPLNMYDSVASQNTFAIVAGIFTNKQSADSLISVHASIFPKSVVIKSVMYVGCLH
jgi:hypothetical protein